MMQRRWLEQAVFVPGGMPRSTCRGARFIRARTALLGSGDRETIGSECSARESTPNAAIDEDARGKRHAGFGSMDFFACFPEIGNATI